MTTIVKDRLFNISKSANIDEKYGPYASVLDATTKLASQNAIIAGLTVGIEQEDGSVKEYWYQPNQSDVLELVKKQSSEVEANPTGAATTPLNKIKIGDTNYNIPQTDTSDLATKQELQQGLLDKQDTINDLSTIRSGAAAGETAVQPSEMAEALEGKADESVINAVLEGILYAFENGLPRLKVQELTIARKLDAYIVEGNAMLSGAGAPSILPQFNGQEYFDTTNKVWYKASFTGTEPTAADWKPITNP